MLLALKVEKGGPEPRNAGRLTQLGKARRGRDPPLMPPKEMQPAHTFISAQ